MTFLRAEAFCLERGISPVEEILTILTSGNLRASDALKGWFELLSYCQPKPRPEGDQPKPVEHSIPDFLLPHLIKSASND